MKNKKAVYNLLALFTIFVWGTTFISTKILLNSFSPSEIMLLRFIIAYLVLWILHPRLYKGKCVKDEILFLIAGFTGGTIYFISENTALSYSFASNVGLILATTPILTAFVAHMVIKEERITKKLFIGFLIALLGVFLIMFNGNFILKLNPLGDILALASAFSWAIYSVVVKDIGNKYNYIYTTRKIFFYSIITMIPFIFNHNFTITIAEFKNITVVLNLLFLGVIASGVCFVIWNLCVNNLGAIKANNFIYFMPLVTVIFSAIILKEQITVYSLFGSTFILAGVYIAEH